MSAAEWHTHTGDASDRKRIVAGVVRCDETRRTVQIQETKTASATEQQVLDFLVSGGTSVIGVTVWVNKEKPS